MEQINYQVHPKENFYFTIRLLISIVVYTIIGFAIARSSSFSVGIGEFAFILIYAGLIAFYLMFSLGILVGYIKGNGIKITESQFPEIYSILESQCEKLGLNTIPTAYILQSGGALNAFATKFVGRNYVIIYSEIFELAYEEGQDALEFIIGHELGHIKRNHITKSLFLIPSAIVPFLRTAYSRACEYTCDNIGQALNSKGAVSGLLILAAGKKLHNKVNIEEYIYEEQNEGGFWKWFAEKVSTHPNLPKRIEKMQQVEY